MTAIFNHAYLFLKRRRISLAAPAFICCVLLTGCRKGEMNDLFDDFSGYLPVVQTLQPSRITNGPVVLKGLITEKGKGDVFYTGFCYSSTHKIPLLSDNQVLLDGSNGAFSTQDWDMQQDTTYYIRSFAANDYGFTYGNVVKFTVPHSVPPVVPCSLPDNRINDNGASYNASFVQEGPDWGRWGKYGMTVNTGGGDLQLSFSGVPGNGIYTTTSSIEDLDMFSGYVHVYLNDGWSPATMNDNDSVYIVENTDGSKTVTMCNLHYTVSSFTIPFNGKFVSKP